MAGLARSPDAANPYPTPENSRSSRYAPYRSVIKHVKAVQPDEPDPGLVSPPWRRKVGEVWFALDSENGARWGEDIPAGEEQGFADIASTMFANFSEREDWAVKIDDGYEDPFEVTLDVERERGGIEGDSSVLYSREEASGLTPRKAARPSQLCWNCREPGHILAECPYPRDHLQIRASRDAFNAQKEAMPEYAQTHLASYTFTAEERDRRLALVSRFTPAEISEELKDALFWVDEEEDLGDGIIVNPRNRNGREEVEETAGSRRMRLGMMAVRRGRGDWPWFEWMLKWGYPPGWIAGKDPMEEVRRRLLEKELETDIPDSDSEDDLEIFGEQNEIAPLPASRSTRRLAREGSADMVLLTPSPSPPPPPPPDEPPTPPPPPSAAPPRAPPQRYPPQRRWVDYHTQLFDSERLQAYSEARPLPLGY